MEAPNKIYKHLTTGNSKLNGSYYEYKPAKIRYDDKIIEYIRKEALLEWAKACYVSMEKNDAISELFKQGALYELKKVINKLNSV